MTPQISNRIWTVPNVLSFVRLAVLPVFAYVMYIHADGWAFGILFVGGASDWLDGKLARLLDQSSRLGALLDPLVDRLYTLTTLSMFVFRELIPWWLAVVLVLRDVVLFFTIGVYRRRGLPTPDVIYLGKAATFALMFAFPGILGGQMDWPAAGVLGPAGEAFLIWGSVLYLWTGFLYLWKATVVSRRVPPLPTDVGYPHRENLQR